MRIFPFCISRVSPQVNVAVDMLRGKLMSLRPLEQWLGAERRRKVQEEAESKDLQADALAQVQRSRQRWCIGSGERCRTRNHKDAFAAIYACLSVRARWAERGGRGRGGGASVGQDCV